MHAAMAWKRRRRRAEWALLAALPCLLAAQLPAGAGRIASQLSSGRSAASARTELAGALAVERLVRLGLARDQAGRVVQAVIASEADLALAGAVRPTGESNRGGGEISADQVREAARRMHQALVDAPDVQAALATAVDDAFPAEDADRDMESVLRTLGCPADPSAQWIDTAAHDPWVWAEGAHDYRPAEAHAKVVGLNYRGLFVLIVPILIVLAVALAAGADAAPFIAGAAIMGLVFVLFTDPAFLFGTSDDKGG